MDGIFLTVQDKNISSSAHLIEQSVDDLNNTKCMYPTNIKYIFEEDDDVPDIALLNESNDSNIENIIIIDIESSGYVSDIQLISDHFQLLSYKDTMEESETYDTPPYCDIKLDVLSRFEEMKGIGERVSLDDLVKLYLIQNEQLTSISNSF
ncbi:hypothetical protein TBLA_0G03010 [Henningerozyma blattae CBS 6284]|uniref:Uncharacterized protein n=1 Tax=Henningerozyma blattae (strain ATCC 34711 / CBS 6284 / DSM 70876 / NBRC 10599 / NRRL Y-10934 / UCD 77-7) TaxID=1071380 RepID=I2H786_HENB6|nr:hypothetical protein TBLA_0G03010 [Tetrapisispora blattae CBS 6284]CCH62238.1 hypothetical protein TBLA_0G03010 [Tetrapisispora blattae CBS 6284]